MRIIRWDDLTVVLSCSEEEEFIRIADADVGDEPTWHITFPSGGIHLFKNSLSDDCHLFPGEYKDVSLRLKYKDQALSLLELLENICNGTEKKECEECFGTGLKGGFQVPCSKGCPT